jgi:hypothetical protein
MHRLAVALDRVDLPVPDLAPSLCRCRALGYVLLTCGSSATVGVSVALAAFLVGVPQVAPQVAAGLPVALDPGIDRLVADRESAL